MEGWMIAGVLVLGVVLAVVLVGVLYCAIFCCVSDGSPGAGDGGGSDDEYELSDRGNINAGAGAGGVVSSGAGAGGYYELASPTVMPSAGAGAGAGAGAAGRYEEEAVSARFIRSREEEEDISQLHRQQHEQVAAIAALPPYMRAQLAAANAAGAGAGAGNRRRRGANPRLEPSALDCCYAACCCLWLCRDGAGVGARTGGGLAGASRSCGRFWRGVVACKRTPVFRLGALLMVVLVLVLVCAALYLFPLPPAYSLCNKQIHWGSVLDSITQFSAAVNVTVLFSVHNPNTFALDLHHLTAYVTYKGQHVAIASAGAGGGAGTIAGSLPEGSVSDLAVVARVDPSTETAAAMALDYVTGSLNVDVSLHLDTSVSVWARRLARVNASYVAHDVDVVGPPSREYCLCQ